MKFVAQDKRLVSSSCPIEHTHHLIWHARMQRESPFSLISENDSPQALKCTPASLLINSGHGLSAASYDAFHIAVLRCQR